MVTEDGLPVDVRIEKSVGHGLDENALQSVSKYRFKPAMKDGKPVAARVAVEVNFRLY
jgi:TonB family protein